MIKTTIAGIWQSHAKSLLTVVLLGGCLPQFNAQIAVETPDLKETQDRLEARSNETGRELIAVVLPLEVDFFDAASFVETNGRRVWSLNVDAPGALATCLYFDDFHLPLGSELFFETPEGVYEKTWVEGPVTAIENNQHRRWSNNEVPGESLTMIYSCPIGVTEEAALGINGLGFFVRHQNFPSPWSQADARVGSGDCHVDVNCPEGDSWECEKDAVVRLRTTFFDESLNQTVGGLCSGSMVNNTARDCRQLMLSAFHCVNDLEEDDWAVFKVQFNYEYSECGGTSSINSRTRTGAIPLTNSNDIGGWLNAISGSDFVLAEVEDPIPANWNPFYAGWDATETDPDGAVGIHHPNGDRKKISTIDRMSTAVPAPHATGAHWDVEWTSTESGFGVTEGGSSGSAIFDYRHRILGTLSSGASACTYGVQPTPWFGPQESDYYGKMSYHWDGPNPIPTSSKLKAFLDPIGTGEEFMDGSYVQMDAEGNVSCDVYTSCAATQVEERFIAGLTVSPNPTAGTIRVTLPSGFELAELRWFDSMGRSLGASDGGQFNGELDLSAWGRGVRYVTVTTQDGWSTTRRVLVQ